MTNAPKPNVELLDRTLAAVRRAARRGLWDQRYWHVEEDCGTVMCFAGYAATCARREWQGPSEWFVLNGRDSFGRRRWIHVRDAAQIDLGLMDDEADALFSHRNTLCDLSRIVREIKQRA